MHCGQSLRFQTSNCAHGQSSESLLLVLEGSCCSDASCLSRSGFQHRRLLNWPGDDSASLPVILSSLSSGECFLFVSASSGRRGPILTRCRCRLSYCLGEQRLHRAGWFKSKRAHCWRAWRSLCRSSWLCCDCSASSASCRFALSARSSLKGFGH